MTKLPVLLALFAASALAQTSTVVGQRWSIVGGRTVGVGSNVVEGRLGWPGANAAYWRGLLPQLDVGARVGFIYAVEGLPSRVVPGFKANALAKLRLLDADKVSLALSFEPGLFGVFDRAGAATLAVSLPVGLKLGYATSSALCVGLSLDVPLWVQFGGTVHVPLFAGLGVEYFLSSDLAVFALARMGPTIHGSGLVEFAFEASVGLAFRFGPKP